MAIPQLAGTHDPTSAYRKLIAALARRAARIGSTDPEGSAQEAVRRALASPVSRHAVAYYFDETVDAAAPEWSLLQLLGWLHGVLRFVVREERARARFHREIRVGDADPDPIDPSPDPLTSVIDAQLRGFVQECLEKLNADHRSALQLRWNGAKYGHIAEQLGVNENTVATWVRRGSLELAALVRERMNARPQPAPAGTVRSRGDVQEEHRA